MNARLRLQSPLMELRSQLIPGVLGLLTLLLAPGCSAPGHIERQPLELDGPVAVRINTFAGNVEVRGTAPDTNGKSFVQVTRHSHISQDDEIEIDEFITWSTTIDRDDRGPVLVVDVTPRDEHVADWWRGHVIVEVPMIDGVTVNTTHGDISVDEVTGPVELITTDGDVELLSDQPLRGPLKILTSEGDVNVRLAPQSEGMLDLFAKNGRVGLHIKAGQMHIEPGTRDDAVQGSLNGGEMPFVIRTTHGVIRFTVKHNPKPHGIFHWD